MNVASGRSMLRSELPTMADLFAATGYRTGQFGKWHLGDSYPYRPQDRGFQQSMWFPASHIPSAAEYWRNTYYRHLAPARRRQDSPVEGLLHRRLFDEAMHWIADRRKARRAFLLSTCRLTRPTSRCWFPTNTVQHVCRPAAGGRPLSWA